jgi:hypothetical protein
MGQPATRRTIKWIVQLSTKPTEIQSFVWKILFFPQHLFFSPRISFFALGFKIRNGVFRSYFCLEYKFWNLFFEAFDEFELEKFR